MLSMGSRKASFLPRRKPYETVEEAFRYVHKSGELKAGRGEKEWKSKKPGANERARDAADDVLRYARKIHADVSVVIRFS